MSDGFVYVDNMIMRDIEGLEGQEQRYVCIDGGDGVVGQV